MHREITRLNPTDQATAQATLITLGDLPGGWSSDPNGPTVRVCAGDASGVVKTASKRASFRDLDHHELKADVALYQDAAMAQRVFAARVTQKTSDCIARYLETTMQRKMGSTATVGHVTAVPLQQVTLDDAAAAYRFTLPVSAQGTSARIVVDTIYFRDDRELGMLESVGLGAVDVQKDADLIGLMAERAQGA